MSDVALLPFYTRAIRLFPGVFTLPIWWNIGVAGYPPDFGAFELIFIIVVGEMSIFF